MKKSRSMIGWYLFVVIAIVIGCCGCVTVTKQTTIFITNPITVVDMQNGDNDRGAE